MYANSVNESPTSSRSRRLLTDSFAIIWLTVKCLPTSRRKSVSEIVVSQSALFNSFAWALPALAEKSRKRLICSPIPATLTSSTSRVRRGRSTSLKLGSPMRPVPPPASAMGALPASCRRRKLQSGKRCPRCSDGAVGSKPMYNVTNPALRRSKTSSSVVWWIRPRNCQSSSTFIVSVYEARSLLEGARRRQMGLDPQHERVPQTCHLTYANRDEQHATNDADRLGVTT